MGAAVGLGLVGGARRPRSWRRAWAMSGTLGGGCYVDVWVAWIENGRLRFSFSHITRKISHNH